MCILEYANEYLSQVTVIYTKLKTQIGTINYLIQGRSKNERPHPSETLKKCIENAFCSLHIYAYVMFITM